MRIVRYMNSAGQFGHGQQLEDGTVERLEGDLFAEGGGGELIPTGETARVRKRLSPVDPVNIFCIGLNYAEHAKEGKADIPERPVVFMKPTSAVTHPGAPILLPVASPRPEVDYECELAVVIGRAARDVSEDDALSYVLGYTCANDVSARWWQKHGAGGQWIRGKGFDTFCPLGPCLVTADQIPDPQALSLSTRLNGQVMQDGSTSDMIFPVKTLIAELSRDLTLLPGTVILTGTPCGVGFARNPPVFLKDGDTIDITVEKIGTLSNFVVSH